MAKKSDLTTVTEARTALSSAGKKLEKSLGGVEKDLALRAVTLADQCLKFGEEELAKFMNPKTRENSLLATPTDISRVFKDARDILTLFAGILKKTEEAEKDIERDELHKRTVALLEKVFSEPIPEMELPIIIGNKDDSSN